MDKTPNQANEQPASSTAMTTIEPDTHEGRAEAIETPMREGEYWRYNGEEPLTNSAGVTVEPGEVLLLTSLRIYRDAVHSVELRLHPKRQPTHGTATIALHAEEFARQWQITDGKAVRGKEIAAIERRRAGAQRAIEQLRDTAHRPRLTWEPEPTGESAMAQADSRARDLLEIRGKMENAALRINEAIKELIPFTEEQLAATKAGYAEAMDQVGRADKALRLLKLYKGEGVEVIHWHTGRKAPPDAPLVVYQRTRYIDQESLYHVLDGGGGADITDTASYLAALADDPAMRNRVIPAERCIVALQPRRRSKRYSDVMDVLQNSKADQATFVLIRNGECLTTVDWDMGTAPLLVPTRTLWQQLFKERSSFGWGRNRSEEERWIGPDDLRFVATLERAENHMREYLTAWVVLAGLHLRERIFAPIAAEEALQRPLNLMVPHEQDRLLEIVRDEEDALPIEHGAWDDLRKRANHQARPGGRAVVAVHDAITTNQPNWYTQRALDDRGDREPQPIEHPKGRTPLVLPIGRSNGELIVRCPTQTGRTRIITLHDDASWWLALEHVELQRLQIHLDHDRDEYRTIAPLAIPAIETLRTEQIENQTLANAITKGRRPTDEATAIEAVRALRALNRGQAPSEAKARRAARRIRNAREGERWIETALGGETLIDVCLTSTGHLVAYSVAKHPGHSPLGLAWARRWQIGTDTNARPFKVEAETALTTTRREPQIVTNTSITPELRAELDGHQRRISWKDANSMHAAVSDTAATLPIWLDRLAHDHAEIDRLAARARYMKETHRNQITGTGETLWPVAVVRHVSRSPSYAEAGVLCLRTGLLALLHAYGGEHGARAASNTVQSMYRHPERKLNEYAKATPAKLGTWIVITRTAQLAPHGATTPSVAVEATSTDRPGSVWIGYHGDVKRDDEGALVRQYDNAWNNRGRTKAAKTEWTIVDHPGVGSLCAAIQIERL